jgi:hypothetical protein
MSFQKANQHLGRNKEKYSAKCFTFLELDPLLKLSQILFLNSENYWFESWNGTLLLRGMFYD